MNPSTPPAPTPEEALAGATEASTETGTTGGATTVSEGAAVAENAAAAETEVPVLTSRGARERKRADAIRSYDFRQSGFLAPSELRRIRLRHEQFVRAIGARLAIFLRVEFNVQLEKLQIVGYQ